MANKKERGFSIGRVTPPVTGNMTRVPGGTPSLPKINLPLLDDEPLVRLADVPVLKHPDNQRLIYNMCVNDGRQARQLNLPITSCPLFKLEDMKISWEMGWRWEDERIIAKEAKARQR